jgi:hypothetical protein
MTLLSKEDFDACPNQLGYGFEKNFHNLSNSLVSCLNIVMIACLLVAVPVFIHVARSFLLLVMTKRKDMTSKSFKDKLCS